MEFQAQKEKFASMQKFLPLLSKFIEDLKTSEGNESKIIEMDSIYNLLVCPDRSATIDELEQCEKTLNKLFNDPNCKLENDKSNHLIKKIIEGKHDNMEGNVERKNCIKDQDGSSEIISNGLMKTDKEASVLPNVEDFTAIIEPDDKQSQSDEVVSNKNTEERCQIIKSSCENIENDFKLEQTHSVNKKETNDTSKSSNSEESCNKNSGNETDFEESTSHENDLHLNKSSDINEDEENVELVAAPIDTSEIIVPDAMEHELCNVSGKTTDEVENRNENGNHANNTSCFPVNLGNQKEANPETILDIEVNGKFLDRRTTKDRSCDEEISMEVPGSNEYEVPDSLQPEQLTDIIPEAGITLGEFKIITVENSQKNPLASNNNTGDDDDVQLIENHNSPICIDSDDGGSDVPGDDDKTKNIEKIKAIAQIRKVVNPPRTFARKSTTQIQQVPERSFPQIEKTIESFTCLKNPLHLVETIDLLDSSDEDGDPKPKKSPTRIMLPLQRRSIGGQHRTIYLNKSPGKYRSPIKSLSKPTAQTNFLNAVNLQPRSASSSSSSSSTVPATFSAQLSNKQIIIPNAFYGNPPSLVMKSSTSMTQKNFLSNCATNRNSSSILHSSFERECDSSVVKNVTATNESDQDRLHKMWLENFLANFSNPLQIASHSCFVLLQRVLKYRFFQRVKESRTYLNNVALKIAERKNPSQMMPANIDIQLLLDLRNVFLVNDTLTDTGRRFCEYASCDALGKSVILTTDIQTRKVTSRTLTNTLANVNKSVNIDYCESIPTSVTYIASNASDLQKQYLTGTTKSQVASFNFKSRPLKKIRKLSHDTQSNCSTPTTFLDGNSRDNNEDEDVEYQPYRAFMGSDGQQQPEFADDEVSQERRKSLRTSRTKRKEKGFSYSEEQDDEEFEALARKIERQKREEIREREAAARIAARTTAKKSTFAGFSSTLSTVSNGSGKPVRKKLRLTELGNIRNDDEDDLLTPTWVETEDAEVTNELVDEYEGYEPTTQTSVPQSKNRVKSDAKPLEFKTKANIKTQNPDENDDDPFDDMMYPDPDPDAPKNTDRSLHLHNKYFEFCVHCRKKIPRIVHHYVNEHPGSEVYTSRIRAKDLIRVMTTANVGQTCTYKNGQIQYEALCIFCDKDCRFMLPYWFEHFTMHTGEYSYKCSACDTLKPTRSLLSNHIANQCTGGGSIARKYIFDTKKTQIEAKICTLCNYVQMHRRNIIRHLKTQHEIENILPEHIQTIVLMQTVPSQNTNTDCDSSSVLMPEILMATSLADSNGDGGDVDHDADQLASGSTWIANSISAATAQRPPSKQVDNYDSTPSFFNGDDYTYDDCDDGDDLSFMICGMLDVATNDVNQTLDSNRCRSNFASKTAEQMNAEFTNNVDDSV